MKLQEAAASRCPHLHVSGDSQLWPSPSAFRAGERERGRARGKSGLTPTSVTTAPPLPQSSKPGHFQPDVGITSELESPQMCCQLLLKHRPFFTLTHTHMRICALTHKHYVLELSESPLTRCGHMCWQL